jgi:hypothetical protein
VSIRPSPASENKEAAVMALVVGLLMLTIYSIPLLFFLISVIHSKNFTLYSGIVRIMGALTIHATKTRDIMGTTLVPVVTPFAIAINRSERFDYQSFLFILIFALLCTLSVIGNALCAAYVKRLENYGKGFSIPIIRMLENYTRENLIFVALLIGASVSKHH